MKKLMTMIALAFTLMSAATVAASAATVFEDAQHGAGAASQSPTKRNFGWKKKPGQFGRVSITADFQLRGRQRIDAPTAA
jgi:opacity protein-like surface antigen